MKRLLIGLTSAIMSFAVTRKLQGKAEQADEQPKEKHEGLVWISAEDVEVEEVNPEFKVGEMVVTYNPYLCDYAETDFDFSPLYFVIEEVLWDEDDECYRYKFEKNDEWYAETWVMTPEHPFMVKKLRTKGAANMPIEKLEGKAKERNVKLQIDYWLATLQDAKVAGDDKGYEEATKALEELTKQ
jgi:hypothetical protein